jgi:anti-sigma regulatory factor (Ser/Thr protein kinase)
MTTNGESAYIARSHDALLYRLVEEYIGAIGSFVQAGIAAGEPVLVAVPHPRDHMLRQILGPTRHINIVDMADLGRNPARIIPAVRSFVHAQKGRPTRFVGEPTWPGRSPAELGEASLHERLLDVALDQAAISILCPYDAAALDPALITDAERIHEYVVDGGHRRRSTTYQPDIAAELFRTPLPPPPRSAAALGFDDDLARLRNFVEEGAVRADLPGSRLPDLIVAVNEVATNALVHGGAPGVLRLWSDLAQREVICDLCDGGQIREPLVGRFGPYPLAQQGWGLWMVNQVCDLVELRSGAWGTNVRLHVRL